METERPKSNARETLTDLVLEFLEAAVHEFLAELMETAGGDEELPLPLTQLEEVFRAELVALVAAQVSSGVDQKDSSKLHTFRILVQTVEDAANRETAVNEEDASNSWVLADPFWCEDQKKPKEIFPLKEIQEANAPVRLNMYLEKPQKVSVTEVHDK
ncbi:unnamed protein product [Phytophthora lilii]|uniref:Unnamed protein product n=1 Tax=Phytophthora lilii TaxID=2077276 RepID=A0A9W6THM5_9STRA|nr:unnamed protein product [Phytophthora lilii]